MSRVPIAAETSLVTVGTTEIPYAVLRSKRRKRTIEIRVDAVRGVLVAVPQRTPAADVADLVRRRAGWILRRVNQIALRPEPKRLVSGECLPYLGGELRLLVEPNGVKAVSVHLEPNLPAESLRPFGSLRMNGFSGAFLKVLVPGDLAGEERRSAVAAALQRWYRARAAEYLHGSVVLWSRTAGYEPREVLVRDQRRIWGSCSANGTLRFNWRLVQLDLGLLEYVVVHELCHLGVRNHSKAFWTEVQRVLHDYGERRSRLRRAGARVVL